MADDVKPAGELEQEARAVNATDGQPMPCIGEAACIAPADRCPDCVLLHRKARR